jgi:glycosyltransferase involved in cell wall biosynthesis
VHLVKIAVVVQGRFHAFNLAQALLKRGHDVTVLTNYPRWAAARFGLPTERVRSFWVHGVVSRGADRLYAATRIRSERWLNPAFGRWAAGELARERWDVIHAWSGVSEEIHANSLIRNRLRLILRGSAHIRVQYALLKEEETRTGARQDCPDEWIQEREEREYALADRIVVLSSFARATFIARGEDAAKLCLLPLGADSGLFRPSPDVIANRCGRILSGEPLTVLYVGALSYQKGLWDLETIVRTLNQERFRFVFVGPESQEGRPILNRLRSIAEFAGKQPQRNLPEWYARGDVFVFPTIQDGFANVLAQAQANALPMLTTSHCGGPELIDHDRTGWVLPIRSPEAFIERLRWCDANRPALAGMVRRLYETHPIRTWDHVAADFEAICVSALGSPVAPGYERH